MRKAGRLTGLLFCALVVLVSRTSALEPTVCSSDLSIAWDGDTHREARLPYCVLHVDGDGSVAEESTDEGAMDCFEALGTNRYRGVYVFAHGGLVPYGYMLHKVDDYIEMFLDNDYLPIIVAWHTDAVTLLKQYTRGGLEAQAQALAQEDHMCESDVCKDDFLAAFSEIPEKNAADAVVTWASKKLHARFLWQAMRCKALSATLAHDGAMRRLAGALAARRERCPSFEIHTSSHSAGALLIGHFISLLATRGTLGTGPFEGEQGLGVTVQTCTLRGAGCSVPFFEDTFLPLIEEGSLERFSLFNLTQERERHGGTAHVAMSVLYVLTLHAYAGEDAPILGLDEHVCGDAELQRLIDEGRIDYVLCPNEEEYGSPRASRAKTHPQLSGDKVTNRAVLARMLGNGKPHHYCVTSPK